MITTRIEKIVDDIYRICTPVPPSVIPGGLTFNQFLIVDRDPLLFHTGGRQMFSGVAAAIKDVMPLDRLRWISFSHHEDDEDGSLNQFLAAAPNAQPLCGTVQAMINADGMDRVPRVLKDQETLSIGKHTVRWIDTPHVPHSWESGFLFEEKTRTLLCGDLFTHPGDGHPCVVTTDILESSEAFRKSDSDYYSHGPHLDAALARLAALDPKILACMHGSVWQGDGAALLKTLALRLKT